MFGLMAKGKSLCWTVFKYIVAGLLLLLLLFWPWTGLAQPPEEQLLYEEDFNDGQAQGWDWQGGPQEGWWLTDGIFVGAEHFWAVFREGDWLDTHLVLTVRFGEDAVARRPNGLHISVRHSEAGRYFVALRPNEVALVKQYRAEGEEAFEEIGSRPWEYEVGSPYRVDFFAYGGRVLVAIDGVTVFEWDDPEPLPTGTIALETLDRGYAEVDNVQVFGLLPAPAGPDLVVAGFEPWSLVEEDDILRLFAVIRNDGLEAAPPTIIRAETPSPGWPSAEVGVPALPPGEEVVVALDVEVPIEQRDRSLQFVVQVDPLGQIDEPDEQNNNARTGEIYIPPGNGSNGPDWLRVILIVTVVSAATTGGVALTLRHKLTEKLRREWESKAKEKSPPDTCQPGGRYCRKIELDELNIEAAVQKITYLTLNVYNGTEAQSKPAQIKGPVVDGLNKAIAAHRRRRTDETVRSFLSPVARMLSSQVTRLLGQDPALHNVALDSHFEGGQVKCQFILYRCVKKGSVNLWEEEMRWTATAKDEFDEPVGSLIDVQVESLENTMATLLAQFVEKQ